MPTRANRRPTVRRTLICVYATAALLALAQEAAAQPPSFVLELDQHATLSTDATEDEFPAVCADSDGRLWAVWISYDGQSDRVVACQGDADGWSQPEPLTDAADHWRPAIGRDGQGRVWVTWSENRQGDWDLWARYRHDRAWSPPLRLTQRPGNDFCQTLAADAAGKLWMAWQAVVGDNYEVLLAEITTDGLGRPLNVSEHPANDWEPALAADEQGALWIAWDSYRGGSYDILARRLDRGHLGPITAIAATADYEAHASLTVDVDGRLWAAWDNGGPNWGQHGESLERLHHRRRVGLKCLHQGRAFDPLQQPATVLGDAFERFTELPSVAADRDGRLWLVLRHVTDLTPPGQRADGRPNQPRGIWNPYVLCYAAGRWSQPLVLPSSNGRNDMRVGLCRDPAGHVYVIWADDGRRESRAEEPVNHNVHVARLRAPAPVGIQVEPSGDLPPLPSDAPPSRRRNRTVLEAAARPYTLLFGDTHRHTDISRCGMNYDGSLFDTYRYALDAAQLDFLAISDHDQDLLKHRYDRKQSPLLGYAWWRSQKYCDLFFIDETFLPIYGYEHGGSYAARGGHKNVLYPERGNPCIEDDAPELLFKRLENTGAVVIPHQLADGGSATDWTKWNPDFERVAEVFQLRGSYEFFGAPREARIRRPGHYLWDALGQGVQIGVIASSDHGLVHGAYAGVYAETVSRRGVLEALQNRRSFGATDTLALSLRLGRHLLGEAATVDGPPKLEMTVQGTRPLKQVQLVRNGEFVYTHAPPGRDCSLQFTDMSFPPGSRAYYYLRAEQDDGQWAWSSAIWVHRPAQP